MIMGEIAIAIVVVAALIAEILLVLAVAHRIASMTTRPKPSDSNVRPRHTERCN
jgi:hypothetical protein